MERTRSAFSELRAQKIDLKELWNTVAVEITDHVGSTRASVWSFNLQKDVIFCEVLYDIRHKEFQSGLTLSEEDFSAYFEAMRSSDVLSADDALIHPSTSCFDEIYFTPNDIMSLLDVIIYDGDEKVGVLCCEHCGERKMWSTENINYLKSMAAVLRLAFRRS